MSNDRLDIEEKNVIAAYNKASDRERELLKTLFPNVDFEPPVIERVKTFDDAYSLLPAEHPLRKEFDGLTGVSLSRSLSAYIQLRIIQAALNQGAKSPCACPVFMFLTKDQLKEDSCLVYLREEDGHPEYEAFAFSKVTQKPCPAFAFKDIDTAYYCGRQFIGLWADYYLGRI